MIYKRNSCYIQICKYERIDGLVQDCSISIANAHQTSLPI